MSLSAVTSPIRSSFPTSTGNSDPYDHEIILQDTTETPQDQPSSPARSGGPSAELTRAMTGQHSLRGTVALKNAIKDEYTRRKYARFQEQRYTKEDEKEVDAGDARKRATPLYSSKSEAVKKQLDARRGRLLERLHLRSKRAAKARDKESAMDILHENQRGLFLFGYPLYSSRSLLNFDPTPWTNAEFQDSPVDIRNAQLPDPTWAWVWKRWYVDMTDDVDEEGWQYSLSFGRRFSWHGTHPWFHSAVRQRRWLRKRVKMSPHHATENKAHELTQDYFTIHSAPRETSRGSSAERGGDNRSSFFGGRLASPDDSESEEEDITNVTSLLKEMRKTTIDRKKLDAVRNFLGAGGDEVAFLPGAMPEVLGMFMFQNSRRQMLGVLENSLHEAESSNGDKEEEASRVSRRKEAPRLTSQLFLDGLRKSIEVVHENIKSVEYYSDVRAMEEQLHSHKAGHPEPSPSDVTPEAATKGERAGEHNKENTKPTVPDTNSADTEQGLKKLDINEEVARVEIRGIPERAGIDIEPGILRSLDFAKDEDSSADQGGQTEDTEGSRGKENVVEGAVKDETD